MIYGVFYPYYKGDVLSPRDPAYHTMPDYPRAIRYVRTYKNSGEMLNAYANTMCPASQTFVCEEKDYEKTIEDLHRKFDDKEWLKENIEPFI